MFLKLLQKLATEYPGPQSYMGGDVEEDLARSFPFDDIVPRRGMVQALYDLGVLVALPAPADGEVTVDAALARKILKLSRSIQTPRKCARDDCVTWFIPDSGTPGPAREYCSHRCQNTCARRRQRAKGKP